MSVTVRLPLEIGGRSVWGLDQIGGDSTLVYRHGSIVYILTGSDEAQLEDGLGSLP